MPDGARLDGLDLVEMGALSLENKVSADIAADATAFIVEFHPDIDPADQHALLHNNGLQEHYHRNLLPHHLMAYGSVKDAERLAEWDEVAYIYPASPALANGGEVYACLGAMTGYGPIGQYVATAGEGWDGAGTGAASLGYYLGNLTSRAPRLQVQTEILRALGEWSKYVQVDFSPAVSPSSQRTVSIFFASGAHGDAYPFDGSGNVLAHTFYPAPPNPETIAGDMHLDNDENWGIGQGIDIFSVTLHEAGHALGLGHSDKPGTVMYPYYSKVAGLTADDIDAVRQLYAARTGSAAPPTTPPTTPATPANPANPTTPTNPNKPANPANPPKADTVAPTLRVLSPALSTVLTFNSTIAISGTASDNVGVTKVTWTDSLGNTATATGAANWKTGDIPLRVGTNALILRAYDAAGNSSWRSVVITRKGK